MKCIYVGFSLSKLQSFFWKISLNSCLIRLKSFNNKNSITLRVCSTWPGGKAFARCTEGPEFQSGQYLFLFASFLFFSSFFFFLFSFSFHFRYNSFVMLLYMAHSFWLTNFLLRFTCRSLKSSSRGPAIYVFLVYFDIVALYCFKLCFSGATHHGDSRNASQIRQPHVNKI